MFPVVCRSLRCASPEKGEGGKRKWRERRREVEEKERQGWLLGPEFTTETAITSIARDTVYRVSAISEISLSLSLSLFRPSVHREIGQDFSWKEGGNNSKRGIERHG